MSAFSGDNEKEKQKTTSSAANQTVTGPSQKLSGMFNKDPKRLCAIIH